MGFRKMLIYDDIQIYTVTTNPKHEVKSGVYG